MIDNTVVLQRTIARPASVSGIGLHTGVLSTVTFRPAAPDSGVTFYRVDLPGAVVALRIHGTVTNPDSAFSAGRR